MANIQKQFEKFHETIRTDYDTNQELRDKRDIILEKIEKSLTDAKRPSFLRLMQGSYIMRTGVKPIGEKEYDIDVGMRFKFNEEEHTATEVRQWVFDAVKNHTDNVEAKGPCIRVGYAKGFHVDLVPYAWWTDDTTGEQFRLAHSSKGWIAADPSKLLKYVDDAQSAFADTEGGTQTNQLRRVIRCLKRWDDVQQPEESEAKPSGLAFTLLSIGHLARALSWDGKPDDRAALLGIASFVTSQTRVVANKPSPEYEDMFAKLSDEHMAALISRFQAMKDALEASNQETDPTKACELLVPIFGDDFPVPPPDQTGKKTQAPAIITSSSSA
ncbi:nucleotidyltransferase domain-containing protein [Myxococcus xanthus]|uniref:Cyclic GMP-AMP synthase n=1 Tax=Myxococcus xanthus TaxID=34 RepID=A0A7Y4IQH9_MYXXA|nr:nucleotidyltransferase [Myxococcus xanthus]NOJ82900.1 nucleotidyltransferase [Myxococcus xanthus]NOJ90182.1 nucleotidyltransferase [Myxococcus xanthus]